MQPTPGTLQKDDSIRRPESAPPAEAPCQPPSAPPRGEAWRGSAKETSRNPRAHVAVRGAKAGEPGNVRAQAVQRRCAHALRGPMTPSPRPASTTQRFGCSGWSASGTLRCRTAALMQPTGRWQHTSLRQRAGTPDMRAAHGEGSEGTLFMTTQRTLVTQHRRDQAGQAVTQTAAGLRRARRSGTGVSNARLLEYIHASCAC